MRTRYPFLAIDHEISIRLNGGVLGFPSEIEAADAKVGVLHIEVVCEPYRAIFVNGNGDITWMTRIS